jgi:hypothetical protein
VNWTEMNHGGVSCENFFFDHGHEPAVFTLETNFLYYLEKCQYEDGCLLGRSAA